MQKGTGSLMQFICIFDENLKHVCAICVIQEVRWMKANIVVYNNHTRIVNIMNQIFLGEGYHVLIAENYARLAEYLDTDAVQLLVTDVVIGKADIEEGIECIEKIRRISNLPIIVVSDKKDEMSKIRALSAGADDYCTTECSPLELLARIKSQLRRYQVLRGVKVVKDPVYRVDELEINDSTRKVMVGEREVKLTPIEYKILKLLVMEKGNVLSIDKIYQSIWNMQPIGADNTIAVHIRHIREKIEENPKEPKFLKVVWGTGYKVG